MLGSREIAKLTTAVFGACAMVLGSGETAMLTAATPSREKGPEMTQCKSLTYSRGKGIKFLEVVRILMRKGVV